MDLIRYILRRPKPDSFKYEPLDPTTDEIRLLSLLPAKRRTSPLRGTLSTARLSDESHPRYHALSYVWGKPIKSFEIWIDGECLRITRNLDKALRDIRPKHEPLVIWIDAICIDQSNAAERGHQVQLMRRVYSKAALVRSWLDVDVDISAAPFKELEAHGASVDWGLHDTRFWQPLVHIFSNPYWSRLWVQQEMLLATKLAFNFRATFADGPTILSFLGAYQQALGGPDPAKSHMAGMIRLGIFSKSERQTWGPDFIMIYNELARIPEAVSLLTLYLNSSGLRSCDPRDHLFGFIGIAQDTRSEDIRVDYNLDPVVVFTQIPSLLIQAHNSLEFLRYPAGNIPRDLSDEMKEVLRHAPTWLPHPGHLGFTESLLLKRNDSSKVLRRIGASINTDPENGITLSAKGIKIESISRFGRHENVGEAPLSEWFEDLHSMISNAGGANDAPFEGSNVFKDYISNVLAHRGGRERSLAFYYGIQSRILQNTEICDTSLRAIFKAGPTQPDEYYGFLQELIRLFDSRRFFSTDCHDVGISKDCDLQTGDEIWVLVGCPVPLILRKREPSGYKLVSQCWIDELATWGERGIWEDGWPGPQYSGPPVEDVVLW